MDFMNLLRSVEAFLFELLAWIIFYPLTLWRCISRPVRMMVYAETELTDKPETQFADALSPPILLFLTVFLLHALELRVSMESSATLSGPLADDRNILLIRAVLFSIIPMMPAIRRVRWRGQPLTRTTLKPAFYSQIYPAVPFVLLVDGAMIVGIGAGSVRAAAGAVILAAGTVWYLTALTRWFALVEDRRYPAAFGRAAGSLAIAVVVILVLATALVLGTGTGLKSDGV